MLDKVSVAFAPVFMVFSFFFFLDLIGTAPAPVTNNFAAAETGGGLLVDVFDMPTGPVSGSAPSVTPGAEENLKKYVS